MNENICLANFGNNMKVSGKVDLQYVLDDGSVIHNESKNTAITSTWAASGLIKSLLKDQTIKIELTDCDDALDLKFPFLKGNVIGYAFLKSAASGDYKGAEIENKRVISFESRKLIVSFTYEWTASQVPGVIRSIGYTLQNKYYEDTDGYHNRLTIPIITEAYQPCFYNLMSGSDKTVYDYFRKVTYKTGGTSSTKDSTGCYATIHMQKRINADGSSSQSKSFKVQLNTLNANSFGNYTTNLYYDVDTGDVGVVVDYYLRETSTSDYQMRRFLYVIDFDSGTGTLKWDVLLKASSNTEYVYFSPFGGDIQSNGVFVKKNGKIYIKLDSEPARIIGKIESEPRFTTTFCYTSPENLKKVSELSDFTFCKRFAQTIFDDGIYDLNYCCRKYYNSSNYVWGWAVNQNNDIGYISSYEYVLDASLSSTNSYKPVNVLIDSENDQLITSCMLMNSNNRYGYLNDGLIERCTFGDEKIYYVPKYYYPGNGYPLNPYCCADAQVFQALTYFNVPAEAQVRPENSGVRVVYELTISNPT